MVVTKINISFVIDEEEASEYTLEDTRIEPPYDNIEIMIRRKKKVRKATNIVEGGKQYRNLHTWKICEEDDMIFFDIAYEDDDDPCGIYPHYWHHRIFKKQLGS